MIEMITIAWFVAGLIAGFLHATMIWRTAHRLTAWTPVLGMLRLAAVAAVLIAAALSGAILLAAAGWVVGFATLSMGLVTRRTNRTDRSSIAHSSE
ncbi:MAG: hypothetical protein HC808_17140 [Candidatus Competibacteraceae bacterium]|nr:hypothetical protein [Candidatus Competibacteraceae bacterium]